jgi:hypothetical protein
MTISRRIELMSVDGDQNFFPVYEPDADVIKQKYREAEEAARAHHYDSTKEGPYVSRRPIQA